MKKRQQIIDTAISLFLSKGYEAVTVSEICKTCDIAYGTFFNHFKTKGNLLWEYVFTNLTKDQSFLEAIYETTAINKLMALIVPVSEVPTRIGAPLLLQFLTLRIQNKEYWDRYEELFKSRIQTYSSLIAQAQKDGDILNMGDPEEILRALRDLMLATQINWAVDPSFDLEKRFAARVETLLEIRPELCRYSGKRKEERSGKDE